MNDKKNIIALGIMSAAGFLSLNSCSFNPFHNKPQNVYGPPPNLEEEFDPSQNEPDEVYGPPSFWDSDLYELDPEDIPDDDYDPESNILDCVYGPPEMFGFDEKEEKDSDIFSDLFDDSDSEDSSNE